MKKSPASKQNITKFILDLLILIGFLLALDPRLTGIAIHEWLTIAGTAAILLHLLLNWNWIAGLTRRLFRKFATKARLNYLLNWLFFIDGILVMLTGIMISEVLLPLFGLQPAIGVGGQGTPKGRSGTLAVAVLSSSHIPVTSLGQLQRYLKTCYRAAGLHAI